MSNNSVENEIVSLQMDNTSLQKGVATALSTLDKLKESLNFKGQSASIDDLQNHASRFSLAGMVNSVGAVGPAFIGLSTVAITALAEITSSAINTGIQVAKALTITPVTAGLDNYETKINAVQTILANTQQAGVGLAQVTGVLKELNDYANLTVYNFADMAKNIGTFTAAGVDLQTATDSIKGIANLAALSGASSQQASTAMYQLSQAIAAGQVHLQDWNSVVNAGIGGTAFQRALAETGVKLGTLSDGALKLKGSMKNVEINGQGFRNSITPPPGGTSWLTSKVLTTALSEFTGDLKDGQLAAMGFSKEQIKAIQLQARTAVKAATQIRTISQLHQALKEEVASSWAGVWEQLIGNFKQAPKLLTPLHNMLQNFFQKPATDLTNLLSKFNKIGGRTLVIQTIKNAFHALGAAIAPVQKAFRMIFPKETAADLFRMFHALRDFTSQLTLSKDASRDLKRTFAGIFAVFDIGWQIVKGLAKVFFDLFFSAAKGSGGILDFTGNIGHFLVLVDRAIKHGSGLSDFFAGLEAVLKVPIHLLGAFASILGNLFSGKGLDQAGAAFGRVGKQLSPLARLFDGLKHSVSGVMDFFGQIWTVIRPAVDKIANEFGKLPHALAEDLSNRSFSDVLNLINTGLLGGILLLVRNFFRKGSLFSVTTSGGLLKNMSESFEALTGSLEAMQTQIQAKTLFLIASAIGLITASVVALSLIDPKKLEKALGAMAAGFAELLGGMAVLTKISGAAGFVKVPLIAASMNLLASSLVILAGAMKIMATMSWEDIAKGLTTTAASLIIIAGAMELMPVTLPITAAGLVLVGIGLGSVAGAMKLMSMFSWKDMGKGLAGIAGSLVAIGLAMQVMPVTLPITAAGLVLVSLALSGIAASMKIFATMSWKSMAKGLVGIAGGIVAIALGMNLMPLTLPLTAAGLVIVAAALEGLAGVAKTFATMSWKELGKAGAAIAGMLLVLAGGLTLMTGTLLGSAALVIAAGALAILTPVLEALGHMSWTAIVKGLVTLAGAFTVLGLAGLVLTPLIPSILGLGVALTLVGAGMALAGAGALAFATAFSIFAAAGVAGIAVVNGLADTLPHLFEKMGEAIPMFVVGLTKGSGEFVKAFVKLVSLMLDGLNKLIPKFGKLMITMVRTGLHGMRQTAPDIINTGIFIVLKVLEGLDAHANQLINAAGDLIAKFIRGVGKQSKKIANAAADAIVDFVNGLADAINSHASDFNRAGLNLSIAIINGMTGGLLSHTSDVTSAAVSVAKAALNGAKKFLGINSPSRRFRDEVGKSIPEGIVAGIVATASTVYRALGDMLGGALRHAKKHAHNQIHLMGFDKESKHIAEAFNDGIKAGFVVADKSLKNELHSIQASLKKGIEDAKKTIKHETEEIKKLEKAPGDNSKALAKARKALAEAQVFEHKATEANKAIEAGLKKHQKEIDEISKRYDVISKKLKKARDDLAAAQQKYNDEQSQVASSFNTLPDISSGTGIGQYEQEVQKQIDAVKRFNEVLAQLKDEGLDDTTYQKLLSEGVSALPFMERLLAAGPAAIQQIDDLDAQLTAQANALGTSVATSMYGAGVVAAQGIVDGLQSQEKAIEKEMQKIGKLIADAIAAALGQKGDGGKGKGKGKGKGHHHGGGGSDRSTYSAGARAASELAEGFRDYSDVVATAATDVGQTAMNALAESLSGMDESVISNLNLTPTITPVLDLTKLAQDANNISSLMGISPFSASVSLDLARQIAKSELPDSGNGGPGSDVAPREVNFTQNNYSPKALDSVTIYRQNKNLINLKKKELEV